MLGEGATTRQAAAALYLSPKTIEYHLRNVYMKLGINSRSALAEALRPAPARSGCHSEASCALAVLAALLALVAATPAHAEYRAAPGRVSFSLPPEHPYIPSIEAIAGLPGGASLVAGTSGRRAFVARLRADGGLDRAYGKSGVAYPDGIFVAGIAVAGDGSVTVVMDARAGASPPPRLVRLDPRGRVDRAYGDGGRLDLTQLNGEGPVAATPDGGVVVAGSRDKGDGLGGRAGHAGGRDRHGLRRRAGAGRRRRRRARRAAGRARARGRRAAGRRGHGPPQRADAARRRGRAGPVVPGRAPAHDRVAPVFDAEGRALVAGTDAKTARGSGRARAARRPPRPRVLRLASRTSRRIPWRCSRCPTARSSPARTATAAVLLTRLGADGAAVAGSGTNVQLGGGSVDDRRLGGGFYLVAGGALRPDGSVLLAGAAGLMGPADEEGDGGDIYTQPALVALRQRGGLVRGFGRVTRAPRVRVRVTGSGAVRVRSSARGLARVTVRRGGRTLARRYVLFRRAGWHTAARVRAGGRVTVRVAANDMAGNLRRRAFVRAVR